MQIIVGSARLFEKLFTESTDMMPTRILNISESFVKYISGGLKVVRSLDRILPCSVYTEAHLQKVTQYFCINTNN